MRSAVLRTPADASKDPRDADLRRLPDARELALRRSLRYGDEEDAMHPMFVKLYLENDADDVLAEENRRRAANRARRARSRQATRVVARDRGRRPAR